MQAIRQTQLLNKRELENATPPSASWHADYRDTAWIYVGGLHLDLTEGDVCIIFSQYGNPTHLNLVRDKETGKSKGFGFLKYEDQRSCDLAVDNLGGAEVLGRLLRVDHTRYKKRDDEDEETWRIVRLEALQEEEERAVNGNGKRGSDTESEDGGRRAKKKPRRMLKQEQELEDMLASREDGQDEDPMREYLIREKRDEVDRAKQKDRARREQKEHRHGRKDSDEDGDRERKHHHRHRDNDHGKHRESRRREDEDEADRDRERNPGKRRGDDRGGRPEEDHDRRRDGDREQIYRRHEESSRHRRSSDRRDHDRDRERRRDRHDERRRDS